MRRVLSQICWLWEKIRSTEDRGFQRFLDNVQYKSNGILRYERVFGEGFVSTGGLGMHIATFSLFFVLESYYDAKVPCQVR